MEIRELNSVRQGYEVAQIPLGSFRHIDRGGIQRDGVSFRIQEPDVVQVEGGGFAAGLVFTGDHDIIARTGDKRRLEGNLYIARILLLHIDRPVGLVLIRVFTGVAVNHAGNRVELAVRGLVNTDIKGDTGNIRQLFAGQALQIQGHIGDPLSGDAQRLGTVVIHNFQGRGGIRVRFDGGDAEEGKHAVLKVKHVHRIGGRPGAHTDCQDGNQQPGNDFLHGTFLLLFFTRSRVINKSARAQPTIPERSTPSINRRWSTR